MKNTFFQNTKIPAIIILLFAVFISSCKEEEVDDPNITYVSINKTVVSVIANVPAKDSIDLNGDAKNDFTMLASANATADTAIVLLVGNVAAAYIDSTEIIGATYKAKNLFTNQQPDLFSIAKLEWSSPAYLGLRRGTEKKGYAGVGDVFIPVLFTTISLDKHYGWIRINVSSDYRTFKVIDGAYHIQADTPVKMGAK